MAVAVLLEDAAAVTGVVLAAASIGLFILTGNPIWDAIGSIIIGLLLGAVAIFLVLKNRKALIGQNAPSELSAGVMSVLENNPAVEAVHDAKATIMSADSFRFKAEIDFDGKAIAKAWLDNQNINEIFQQTSKNPDALQTFLETYGEHICDALGDEIDRIETEIRAAVPAAKHVDLEAD